MSDGMGVCSNQSVCRFELIPGRADTTAYQVQKATAG